MSPLVLDPAIEEAMQSALDIQSIFLDISLSTIAGHLAHSALEFRRAKGTTFVSEPEAHLQAVPAEEFPKNQDIIQHSACKVAA
jgi:hypothetical protein